MEHIPFYLHIAFGLITLATVWSFYSAAGYTQRTLIILIGWIFLQSGIGLAQFYTNTNSLPPRFLLLVIPPVLLIFLTFVSREGKQFIDRLDTNTLTLLHIVRFPVELMLFGLYHYGAIPEIMTFEGRNWDILSGISAPFIYYFSAIRPILPRYVLLIWNIICLGLLINIVTIAVLSLPFPFQQFGADQPNIAVLHFPYLLLPGLVVPLVLISHLAAIRQLLRKK